MAVLTSGTKATTTFASTLQSAGPSTAPLPAAADIATLNNAIVDDQAPALGAAGNPGSVAANMQILYVPNRGYLSVLPNDWIAVSPAGFPYLIPAIDLATTVTATGTPVSGSAVMVMTTNVIAKGWVVGGIVTGTNVGTGATITKISADGLTLTLSVVATGSPGAVTITYGSFTHS